jgi:hypothetical protein
MLKLVFFTLIFLYFLNSSVAIGQDEEGAKPFAWVKGKRPFIEASYGLTMPKHKELEAEFALIGSVDIKLGYSEDEPYRKLIYQNDDRYVFFSYSREDLNQFQDEEDNVEKVKTEFTRFGFGNQLGYGYRLGPFALLPYQQGQFTLTKIKFDTSVAVSDFDRGKFDRYEGGFKFGVSTEGGLEFELIKSFSVSASYEAAVNYPGIIFFHWLGGVIVQTVTMGLISRFAEDIVDSSPALGPLMYALLRNAAGYGLYIAMRDNMFWPVKSEKPLTSETLRIGAKITF